MHPCSLGRTKHNAVQRGQAMTYGLFGTFDYDTWLSTHEDHEELFQGDEDEAYDKWKDEQLEDEKWKR